MDEAPTSSPQSTDAAPAITAKKKKKSRVRSAWISFLGRVVAQIVGAAASIVLAVLFVQKSKSTDTPPRQAAAVAEAPVAARPAVKPADGRITLAVLPLANFSGDSREDYFADGMTEALITDLAQIDGLRVISRTSVMQYRTQPKAIPRVAEELGANMIVEGSFVKAGDRVRVTVQLIDAPNDVHVWARTYEQTLRDVLSMQGQLASAIAKEVKIALTPKQENRLTDRAAVDPSVYELYLRGRHAWNLKTDAGLNAATTYFEDAIRWDPKFALAYAGLADVYALPGSGLNPAGVSAEAKSKAIAAATKALELDDSLAEAHTSRGGLYLFQERNRAEAEREFLRAIALNPGYPTTRQWYAIMLSEAGRDQDALTQAREAVALDPLSGAMRQTLGLVHYYGRRYKDAEDAFRRALDLAPQLPLARAMLAKSLFLQGVYAEAAKVGESAPAPHSPDLMAITGLSYLKTGDTARADAILKDLRSRSPLPSVSLAQWYAVAGEGDQALAMLSRGAGAGVVPTPVGVDPLFDSLRKDARFSQLVARNPL